MEFLPNLRLAKAAEDVAQGLLRLMRGAMQRSQHLLSAALEVLVEEEEADAAGKPYRPQGQSQP